MASHRRLRIAFVADTFDAGLGGGPVSATRFVKALRRDHDVVVLTANPGDGPDRVVTRAFQLPLHAMRSMRFSTAIPRRADIDRLLRGADVVHLQYPFMASFRVAAEARRRGIPVVAAFHVQPENLLLNIGIRSKRLTDWLYGLWVRRLYDRADAVVCPSQLAQRKLLAHGLARPTTVISNGMPPGYRRRTMAREHQYEGCFLVLMVGRLATEKRHDVMLEALRQAKHAERIRLVIAGAGPLDAPLRRAAQRLPHPPEVGFVSDGRLERLYNTADLLVHCSEVELEGMAVLEAIGCGLPALVADSPESAATQFALGPDFLFRSGSAADLAAKLDHHVEHWSALTAARARAAELARAFDFEACVAKLVDVYRSVLRAD